MKIDYTSLLVATMFFAALAIPLVFAAAVTSSASVTNVAPTVGTVTAVDPVTLAAGSTASLTCNATITDTNGYSDVSSVNATLWDPAATTETATNDFNNHYTNTSCALSSGSGTTINAVCTFTLQYYANPAEWTCKLNAFDAASASGSANVSTVTVSSLAALSVPSTIAYSELALGGTSVADVNHTVTNYGNIQIDVQLSGSDAADNTANSFNCTIGTAGIGQVKYNVTNSAQDYTANMTALTGSAVTRTEFDLAQRTSDVSPITKDTYWKLKLPTTGVGGSCTGKQTFDAIAG